MGKAFAIIFVILLAVMALAVLVTEKPIETPANEIILSESDFESNWTSFWVVRVLEGPPYTDPVNYSMVMVEHYNNYPIEYYYLDLEAVVVLSINATISEAVNFYDLSKEAYSTFVNVTALDIGDEGFLYEIDDWFGFQFRVKNVIVNISFLGPADLDPSSILVQELIDLQLSKITYL